MSCEFSELIPSLLTVFAPSPANLIALVSNGTRLTIRDSISLAVLQVQVCLDKIDELQFSPDGCFILCGLYARNAIQVFSVADPEWNCRINEGAAGKFIEIVLKYDIIFVAVYM